MCTQVDPGVVTYTDHATKNIKPSYFPTRVGITAIKSRLINSGIVLSKKTSETWMSLFSDISCITYLYICDNIINISDDIYQRGKEL